MTEYIKNQLIKLCDNPEWFNDMLNTWDFKPRNKQKSSPLRIHKAKNKRNPRHIPK